MKKIWNKSICWPVILLVCLGVGGHLYSYAVDDVSHPSVSAIPSTAGSGATTPRTQSYLKEFLKAQRAELKALERKQKADLKSMKAAQKLALQDWERKEKETRHTYFADHPNGPERRDYIQSFLKRRDQMRVRMAEDITRAVQKNEQNLIDLKSEHSVKLEKVEKAIRGGGTPEKSLWPSF